jgi:hypothetical protein
MKPLFFFFALTLTFSGQAKPLMPISVKERLRIVLWYEGIQRPSHEKIVSKNVYPELPEEIERPLRKF